ncbi:MAG: cysteine desulfurase NifS [Clostridia bacterium]|jgi:cysteine desulfurase|nr:cysteine desulfurase NifS [Clostridia bacterium]
MKTVYADNAATTALCPEALEVMVECLKDNYGNASSMHHSGQAAADVVFQARQDIADCIGADVNEIYFTSGGTESDNWAITNAARLGAKKGKNHIISTSFEHHAVLHTLMKLEKEGFEVTYLDVHEDGYVRIDEFKKAIKDETCLVTIMYANNEIGTVQPVEEIGAICKEKGIYFHTDAVQAVGHLPINVKEQNIDMLSFSAHKFHGPKGIGALYCRKGIPLIGFMQGGAQERNKRPGTTNTPAIAATAAALKKSCEEMDKNIAYVSGLRDKLIDEIVKIIPRTRVNGGRSPRLPGNVSFCFEGIEGESLLLYLDLKGICGSSGSACTSGSLDPSHVLLALGLPHEIAHGSLRLSLSEYNTEDEIDYIIEQLPLVVNRLRDMSPVWEKIMKGEN